MGLWRRPASPGAGALPGGSAHGRTRPAACPRAAGSRRGRIALFAKRYGRPDVPHGAQEPGLRPGVSLHCVRHSRARRRSPAAGPPARCRRAPARPRRLRTGRRPVARVGAGLRQRRHGREPAGSDDRARRSRARPAPLRGHEPGGLLRPAGGSQRGVRPRGLAGRFPHDPPGGHPTPRRAELRGGPAARPRRGRGDRPRHRGGAAPRGGADRGRRLRDRGRDCQPAHLGPRLRALRAPRADGPGGRARPALAERPARRELGTDHRRRGREERLLRLRAGRAGAGGRGRPGGAGVRPGVPGGHERVLGRGRPLRRRRHERGHQERHQRPFRLRRPLPAGRPVGGPAAAVAARRRTRRAGGRCALRGGRVPALQLGRLLRRAHPARPHPFLRLLRSDRPAPAVPAGHPRPRALRRRARGLPRAGGRLPAERRRNGRGRSRARPHRERAVPAGDRQPDPVRQARPPGERPAFAHAALQLHELRARVGLRRRGIPAVRPEPLHGGGAGIGSRAERRQRAPGPVRLRRLRPQLAPAGECAAGQPADLQPLVRLLRQALVAAGHQPGAEARDPGAVLRAVGEP